MKKIFVGNLSSGTTAVALRKAFEQYGIVARATIVCNIEGQSKGFGFVEMPDESEAAVAITSLHCSDLEGRTLTVKQAVSKGVHAGGPLVS